MSPARTDAEGFGITRFSVTPTLEIWAAVIVFAGALLVYLPGLWNGFAYDDVVIITGDMRVTEFQLANIFIKPYWTTPGFALYRPLVTLTFAVDWYISSGSSAWFHAMNALWHATASVALLLLLEAWFDTRASLAGALLFAVHPVHTEAVANVVGRAELMAGAFVLVACACWAHEWPRNRRVRFGFTLLCFALAMLCKESSAVLPGLLVLIDAAKGRWRGARDFPRYLRTRAIELTLFAVVIAAAFALRGRIAGSLTPTEVEPIMEVIRSPAERIRTALQVWPTYVRLLFFPVVLLADYGPRIFMPAVNWTPSGIAGLLILTVVVGAGLILLARGRGLAALLALWFPLTILPVANLIVPIGVMLAERTLYMPSVVVSLLLAAALGASRLAAFPRQAITASLALLLVLLAARTIIRIPDWDSTDRIMMSLMRDRPTSFRANWHVARMARRDDRKLEAVGLYKRAVELWPYRRRLIVEAAGYASTISQNEEALRLATHGIRYWPRDLQLQRLVAANALELGDTATAIAAAKNGLAIDPNDSMLTQMTAALNRKTPR